MKNKYFLVALVFFVLALLESTTGFIVGMVAFPIYVEGTGSMLLLWIETFFITKIPILMLPSLIPLGISVYAYYKYRKTKD